MNENQLALEAAIMELSNWVEARGSADVADNVRGALDTIDKNEEFIKLTLAVLMTPERSLTGRNRPAADMSGLTTFVTKAISEFVSAFAKYKDT